MQKIVPEEEPHFPRQSVPVPLDEWCDAKKMLLQEAADLYDGDMLELAFHDAVLLRSLCVPSSSGNLKDALEAASSATAGLATPSSLAPNQVPGSATSDEWAAVEARNPWLESLVGDWKRLRQLCAVADCDDGWTEIANYDGIRALYRKEPPSSSCADSRLHTFKLHFTLHAPLARVAALIAEVELFPTLTNIVPLRSTALAWPSRFSRLAHMGVGLYWPFDDRDCVLSARGADLLSRGGLAIVCRPAAFGTHTGTGTGAGAADQGRLSAALAAGAADWWDAAFPSLPQGPPPAGNGVVRVAPVVCGAVLRAHPPPASASSTPDPDSASVTGAPEPSLVGQKVEFTLVINVDPLLSAVPPSLINWSMRALACKGAEACRALLGKWVGGAHEEAVQKRRWLYGEIEQRAATVPTVIKAPVNPSAGSVAESLGESVGAANGFSLAQQWLSCPSLAPLSLQSLLSPASSSPSAAIPRVAEPPLLRLLPRVALAPAAAFSLLHYPSLPALVAAVVTAAGGGGEPGTGAVLWSGIVTLPTPPAHTVTAHSHPAHGHSVHGHSAHGPSEAKEKGQEKSGGWGKWLWGSGGSSNSNSNSVATSSSPILGANKEQYLLLLTRTHLHLLSPSSLPKCRALLAAAAATGSGLELARAVAREPSQQRQQQQQTGVLLQKVEVSSSLTGAGSAGGLCGATHIGPALPRGQAAPPQGHHTSSSSSSDGKAGRKPMAGWCQIASLAAEIADAAAAAAAFSAGEGEGVYGACYRLPARLPPSIALDRTEVKPGAGMVSPRSRAVVLRGDWCCPEVVASLATVTHSAEQEEEGHEWEGLGVIDESHITRANPSTSATLGGSHNDHALAHSDPSTIASYRTLNLPPGPQTRPSSWGSSLSFSSSSSSPAKGTYNGCKGRPTEVVLIAQRAGAVHAALGGSSGRCMAWWEYAGGPATLAAVTKARSDEAEARQWPIVSTVFVCASPGEADGLRYALAHAV